MSNPFQSAPQTAPPVPDAAPQQAPQAAPPQGYGQPVNQTGTPAFPSNQQAAQIPGQPWSPQQHQAYGQAQGQPGYAPAPQQAPYTPPQPVPATPQPTDPAAQFAAHAAYQQAPANYQTHQQFAQQQTPQAAAPAFAQQQTNGVPTFAQQPQAGAPAFAQPGGQIGPDIFSAPAAAGMGRRPGWRDLLGRFVLVRVTARGVERDTYDKQGKELTLDANIAVLDGGQIVMSPKQGDPNSVAEVFSQVTPCVIDGMIITSKGLQNRLKTDFTRGRIVREPINELQKMLKDVPGDQPLWWKLEQWLTQDPKRVYEFKSAIMWSIAEDSSEAANAMTAGFLQTNEGQTFCR